MIILAATPIGNIDDASPRLRRALAETPVIAAEDTRTTLRLMRLLGIAATPRMVSLHDHNEVDRVGEVLDAARSADVLVVSDAGMPTVSDPGYHLVAAARAEGVPVQVIPGPSAAIAALAASGLPTDRFTFEGFVARKDGERSRRLAALAMERRTMIFYESPHRLATTLASMADAFGADRAASVSRELTKKFEETVHGTITELQAWAKQDVRGEVVLVVAGASAPAAPSLDELADEAIERAASGMRLKDAAAATASEANASTRAVYERALRRRDLAPGDDSRL